MLLRAALCEPVLHLAKKAPRVEQRTIWFFCGKTMVLGGRRRRIRHSLNFAGGRRRSHLPKACRHKYTGAAGHIVHLALDARRLVGLRPHRLGLGPAAPAAGGAILGGRFAPEATALAIPSGTPPGCEPLSWSRCARRHEPPDLSPGDPAAPPVPVVPPAATSVVAPRRRRLTDCVGETDGPGGGGVSARVPSVRRRHPADRVQTAFRVRNHPWPSHSWQPPVAADFLSAIRG